MERLQGRGSGAELPHNIGDLTPDHGDRGDLAPIRTSDAQDGGGNAETEVTELEATLDETSRAVSWRSRADKDGFKTFWPARDWPEGLPLE
jgi:hypothetical protein